jgi:hypothetical protein
MQVKEGCRHFLERYDFYVWWQASTAQRLPNVHKQILLEFQITGTVLWDTEDKLNSDESEAYGKL